jgi:hypothetical protein
MFKDGLDKRVTDEPGTLGSDIDEPPARCP